MWTECFAYQEWSSWCVWYWTICLVLDDMSGTGQVSDTGVLLFKNLNFYQRLRECHTWEDEDDEPLQFTAWLIQVPYADGCRVVAAYWTIGATLCAHMLWPE
jgi:hypothetical protein